jgi:hypothetical protein
VGFKFKQADTGSGGDFFNANALADAGARLLVRPTAYVPKKSFPFGTADSVEADVVDLDTNRTFYRADIVKTVVRDALKEDFGELFLIRLKHGSKAMLFENLSDPETVQLAEAYLAGHPGFVTGQDREAAEAAAANGQSTPAPATTPVAQAAPQANPLQQAAAAFGDDVKKMARSVFESLPADAQAQVLATGVQVEG